MTAASTGDRRVQSSDYETVVTRVLQLLTGPAADAGMGPRRRVDADERTATDDAQRWMAATETDAAAAGDGDNDVEDYASTPVTSKAS